ncbi:MAG: hypothetical protein IT204_20315 [Fimbriimonadaceae bacterium]|nr:hypothetical protein [Fimbriimonadaceae bacterium]
MRLPGWWIGRDGLRLAMAGLVLLVAGCGGGLAPVPDGSAQPTRAWAEQQAGFDFLPPLNARRDGVGSNVSTAMPVVEVWTGTEAQKGALVASFERPQVLLQEGCYSVDWDTAGSGTALPPGTTTCVIEVWWGDRQLGFVDCQIDRNNGNGKKAADPEFFGLKNGRTLPIKFVIDATVPLPQPISVAVTPLTASLAPGGTQQFQAAVAHARLTTVTWSVTEPGGGSVDSSGLYTAPSTPGVYHVVATSVADPSAMAAAEVTVVSPDVPLTFGGYGSGDGQFRGHIYLAAGPGDEIFATDTYPNRRIQVFSSGGQFLRKWGGAVGSGPGQFISPAGLAVTTDGLVYVVDNGRDDVQVFDSQGVYQREFGEHGSGPGQLWVPYDVAVSPDGQNVYVTDTENYQVDQFTALGTFVRSWGGRGGGNGQFGRPEAIHCDTAGNVWVSDGQLHGQNNHRIQKFDAAGQWLATYGGPSTLNEPMGLIVVGNLLHVADFRNYQMEAINVLTGATSSIWAQGPGSALGQVDKPFDVTVDSRGNLYVGESYEFGSGNARIQKFVGVN